ncbi:MAG: glycosyltransferase family 2 protein [Rhodospirillales bacterium]|nr:glycosyltransferase family 2 protein [Alphaproteobacteria bacterium]MCB9981427.1 glycosyltransferase family 2 protein [Rhodospirillales bacterium]
MIYPYVIIATKGRAKETYILLDYLGRQTLAPAMTLVVGADENDIAGLNDHPYAFSETCKVFISSKIGLTCQRNAGLEALKTRGAFDGNPQNFFCAFFDDDFRPAPDWLENAATRFAKGDIVGLTGRVLADGVMSGGYSEEEAAAFLSGQKPPPKHWANQSHESETDCAYGCNMAFLGTAVRDLRFDENLPLYSWQEDRDFTGQCLRLGRVIRYPDCVGVHMGVSGGRTSGLRFGYSQIANLHYLINKSTVPFRAGFMQAGRNFAANIVKTLIPIRRDADYTGRLRGNLMALFDILRGKCDPRRITEKGF